VLTGSLPYDAPDAISMITAHWRQAPRPPGEALPGIPQKAADVLLAGLAKEPGSRPLPFQLVEVLRSIPDHAWPSTPERKDPPAQQGPNSDAAVPAPEPPERLGGFDLPSNGPGRRRRLLALAAGVVVVVTVAVIGLSLTPLWDDSKPLEVRDVTLDVAPDTTGTCPRAEFRFTATIRTNGQPGELQISWIRPDGVEVPPRPVTLGEDQHSVVALFQFTFRGSAPRAGPAVIRVEGDDAATVSRRITYTCAV
jgi:hypothetical protein